MMVTTLTEEHQQAREGCVYFILDDWCLLEAAGKDIFSFLQSQTTNDVLNLAIGAGLSNALVWGCRAKGLCSSIPTPSPPAVVESRFL